MNAHRLISISALFVFVLTGCMQAPGPGPRPQGAVQSSAMTTEANAPVSTHNLSQVAKANPVSAQQLAALQVGVSTVAEVTALLGEVKPFSLGDGKKILRYDVGKFIFDQQGVLIRQFLSP